MNPFLNEDETMLKIYRRRLMIADNKADKERSDRDKFESRYANEPQADQVDEEGHYVSVVSGIGIVDTMYASMTAVDVEFLCRTAGNGTALQSLAATAGLNAAWKDAKGQRKTKGAVKDAVLVDIGWVKVYYDYLEETMLKDVPSEALEAQIREIADQKGIRAEDVPDDELTLTESAQIVTRDRICLDYVPWDMIRADTNAKRIEDVRWVCQYTKVPVFEVQNNPAWAEFVVERYGKVRGRELLEDIKGDTTLDGYEDPGAYTEVTQDDWRDGEMVTVCEMWDLVTGLVTTFPKGRNDVVLYQRENPLMINADFEDRNPFKPLVVRKSNKSLAGVGDMRVIYPALEELDEYRTNLSQYISRTIPKLIGPSDGLTDKGKAALKSPVWGELVETNGVEGGVFQPLTPPPLPQEALQVPDRIQVEMKDGTGVSEPMRGVFPSKRTTATETQIVTDRGDMRQSERRSALEEWYLAIAKTMLQLMQTYYDQDRMLRYIDDQGQEFTWAWNAEDIAIDADISISLTPKDSPTRDERVQRFLLLMNLALPLPEADRAEFIRQAALEMGYRNDEINMLIKSDSEIQTEQEMANAQALGTQPQAGVPGLAITPGGGGGG